MKFLTRERSAMRLPDPRLREYQSRTLAYLAAAASIAAGTYSQHFGYDILWLVPYTLLYPHLAHQLSQRFKLSHPQQTDRALLLIDAVHAGTGMTLLGFSLVPSLMFVLTLSFSALILGGLRSLTLALLGALIGAVLSFVAVAPELKLATPALVSAVSILFTLLYVCIAAFLVHQQAIRLDVAREEVKKEQEKAARLASSLAKYLSPQVWESIFSG
ncbi:MAG: adenylate cyclase, partial [Pseudomonas sp.]|nr:adenylate cyclase [Pseudomonas sp.]